MALQRPTLAFSVQTCQQEPVSPAKPTPHEIKLLSDIGDQDSLRFQLPLINFCRYQPKMAGKDPVQVIRQALAQALVFYYPFAGRIRKGLGRKLMVDCNGEGVAFIEADADVTLDQFGDSIRPPFPFLEELLYDVAGSGGIIDCPLLLIQVTRLKCGGFIVACRLNHTMSDGSGFIQFMGALSEIANGACEPSVPPAWCRELLSARDPPRITCTHHEYEQVPNAMETLIPLDNMINCSFFFGPNEVAAIRQLVPSHLRQSSKFEILTACPWRCRTIALQFDPNNEVRIIFPDNVSSRLNPKLPLGYYGNSFVNTAAVTTARKFCGNPLGYALELIKKTKAGVNEEYVHSVIDSLVINGRPHYTAARSFIVADVTRAEFQRADFGWGKAVYGGIAKGHTTNFPELVSNYMPSKNAKGERGTIVPICLPMEAMERFTKELDEMLKINTPGFQNPLLTKSSL